MNINNPIPEEWGKYITQSPVGLEIVPSMLYSVKDFIGGTTLALTFFDQTGVAIQRTNMKQPSMLANPESFLVQNIRLYFWNQVQTDDSGDGDDTNLPSQFNDLVKLVTHGVLRLTIGEKRYGPWPLWTLPCNSFIKGAFSTGSDLLADYGQLDGNLYPLIPNLMIAPLQNFVVSLEWDATIALSQDGDTPATLPIEVLFDGQLARAIQ